MKIIMRGRDQLNMNAGTLLSATILMCGVGILAGAVSYWFLLLAVLPIIAVFYLTRLVYAIGLLTAAESSKKDTQSEYQRAMKINFWSN